MSLSSFLHTVKFFQVLLYDNHIFTSVICLHTQFVLFDPLIGPYQVLPLQFRVDQEAMAMKRYSTFFKSPRPEPCHQIVWCHYQDTHWGVRAYSSAEMQSMYSTAPVNWAYRLELSGIFLMCLSVPFLIIPKVTSFTWAVVILLYTSLASDRVPWMNLADSMRSQDNMNNEVSQEREK